MARLHPLPRNDEDQTQPEVVAEPLSSPPPGTNSEGDFTVENEDFEMDEVEFIDPNDPDDPTKSMRRMAEAAERIADALEILAAVFANAAPQPEDMTADPPPYTRPPMGPES